jgi:hypothetical protein
MRGVVSVETRDEYLEKEKKELGEEFSTFAVGIDNEYYSIVEKEVKGGKTISQAVHDSLTAGQKFHFNKHYNHRGDKVHK